MTTERLRALGELYGLLVFFHPHCADPRRARRLDRGLVEAVGTVRRGDFAGAVQALLALCDDPTATYLLPAPRPLPPPDPQAPLPYVGLGERKEVLLTIPSVAGLRRPEATTVRQRFWQDLVGAPRGVLDLRHERPLPDSLRGVLSAWLQAPVRIGGTERVWFGFPSEGQPTSGGFHTAVLTHAPELPVDLPTLTFLVHEESELPPLALAAVAAGRGSWSPEPGPGALARAAAAIVLPLGEGLRARVRVSGPPGTPAPLVPERAAAPKGDTALASLLRLDVVLRTCHPESERFTPAWAKALGSALAEQLAAGERTDTGDRLLRRLLCATSDGHARLLRPEPWGTHLPPVRLRWIDGQPVIVRLVHPTAEAEGLRLGDAIVMVDGEPVGQRLARLTPLLPAATEQARQLYICNRLLLGDEKPRQLLVQGADGRRRTVRVTQLVRPLSRWPERDGSPLRSLGPGMLYADLDRLTVTELDSLWPQLPTTKVLLLDLRGYVEETAWVLAAHLAPRDGLIGARFERPIAAPPSAGEITARRLWERFGQRLPPREGPGYRGKLLCLIDERTQSQAEHTVLFLEVCGARLVGSTTAGAVGDITEVALPSGDTVRFTGQRVLHADGRPVSGVGIAPHHPAHPTRAGIAAGRDEVLATALRLALSRR